MYKRQVDIHLAAAIGTIKQACEGSCFAPAVRVASDIPTDFLRKDVYKRQSIKILSILVDLHNKKMRADPFTAIVAM